VPELDIRAILEELIREDVEFVLIGGVAVGYHGHIRATKDVCGDEALWDRLSTRAVEDKIGGLPIKMVSYEDLVALKEEAGRPEDLADLRRLRQARGEE
jgi:predicted nucleotidyltransferase